MTKSLWKSRWWRKPLWKSRWCMGMGPLRRGRSKDRNRARHRRVWPSGQRAGALGAGMLLLAPASIPGPVLAGAASQGVDVARAISSVQLGTLDGGSRMVQLRDRITVVNFWASWCAPCKKELPELDRIHAAFRDRGVQFVAISIDRDVEKAGRFIAEQKIDLPVYHDRPEGLARALDLPHLPYTYVIDDNGDVVLAYGGAGETEMQRLRSTLERLGSDRVVARTTGQD